MDKRLRITVLVVSLFLSTIASRPLLAKTWYVPGVANTPGSNGTFFVSDLSIANSSETTANVTVGFIPMSGGAPAESRVVSIPPRATHGWTNVLLNLWGLQNAGGSVVVSSDGAVAIQARTYNTRAAGTYGLALPVIDSSRLLRGGERGVSAWAAQSAAFRSNVGLVFPDPAGGAASVTLFDSNGALIATRTYDVSSPTFVQDPLVRWSDRQLDVARVSVDVTRGRAYGYTAVADNTTGDSSVFPTDRVPSRATDLLVGGVGRTPGANLTYYQTDLRIWNPAASTAAVSVFFLRPGVDNSGATPASMSLAPGEVREVPDVLGTLFSAPDGATGALRVTSATPLVVLARTSNLDPTHVNPATFGAQQTAVSVDSLVIATDGPSTLADLRLGASYRTNLGFVSGAAGASYHLDFLSDAGQTVATRAASLPPLSWSQAAIQTFFDSPPATFSGSVRVVVDSGSVSMYSSVVDQLSGDASIADVRCEVCSTPLIIQGPDSVCPGSNATFTVPLFAGTTYEWSVAGGSIVAGAGTNAITVQPSGGGAITASLTGRHGGYLTTTSTVVPVAASAGIASVSITPASVGKATTVTWTTSGTAPSVTLTGSDLPSPVVLNGSKTSWSYVPSTAGSKTLIITPSGACASAATFNYSVSNATTGMGPGSSGGGGRTGVATYPGASGRQYMVYVPNGYNPAEPIPVVFAWGGQGEPAEMTLDWQWATVAQRDNIIVVTMTASSSGPGYSGAYDQPEFDTIELAEQQVPRLYNVAVKHQYIWGFSAGAHVSYAFGLAVDGSTRFAAMAIQAGAIEAFATQVSPPSWPPQPGARRIPVYISCGTADTTGWGGGLIGALRRNRDMLATEGYPVQTREIDGQVHTYTAADVEAAWSFLKANAFP